MSNGFEPIEGEVKRLPPLILPHLPPIKDPKTEKWLRALLMQLEEWRRKIDMVYNIENLVKHVCLWERDSGTSTLTPRNTLDDIDEVGTAFLDRAVIGGGMITEHPLLDSCVAQWKLNEIGASSVIADAVGSNTGALRKDADNTENAEDHDVTGKLTGALDMSLNSCTKGYIDCGNDSSIMFTAAGQWSYSFWMKAYTAAASHKVIASCGGLVWDATDGWLIKYGDEAETLIFQKSTGDGATVVSHSGLIDGNWHLVVITYDNGVVRLYVDNVLEDMGQDTFDDATVGFRIGCGPLFWHDAVFTDGIDNFLVFNRVLYPSDVAVLWNSGNGREDFGADALTKINTIVKNDNIFPFYIADSEDNLLVEGDLEVQHDLYVGQDLQIDGALDLTSISPKSILLRDNMATTLAIKEGDNDYLTFVTTDGSEKITISKILDLDADLDLLSQATVISIKDNEAAALDIKEGETSYLKFVTTDDGEKIVVGVEIEGSNFDINGGTMDGVAIANDCTQAEWDAAYNDKVNAIAFDVDDGIITITQQDSGTLTTVSLDGRYYTEAEIGAGYQPLDAELTALAGLSYSAASYIRMTAAGTFDLRTYANVLADLSGQAGAAFSWNEQSLTNIGAINTCDTITLVAGEDITLSGDGIVTTGSGGFVLPNEGAVTLGSYGSIVGSADFQGDESLLLSSSAVGNVDIHLVDDAGDYGNFTVWDDEDNPLFALSGGSAAANIAMTGTLTGVTGLTFDLTQDYKFGEIATAQALYIQGQTENMTTILDLFSKDGDGTDSTAFNLFAIGTPTQLTNTENATFGWNSVQDRFRFYVHAAGSGTVRPLVLYTGDNTDQLLLNIDGSVSMSGALAVTGELTAAKLLVAADTFIDKDEANNMTFEDVNTGSKTLAELAAGGEETDTLDAVCERGAVTDVAIHIDTESPTNNTASLEVGDQLGIGASADRVRVIAGNTDGYSNMVVGQDATHYLETFWVYDATAANSYGRIQVVGGNRLDINPNSKETRIGGDLLVNSDIGVVGDTDLLQLAADALTVNGTGHFSGDLDTDGAFLANEHIGIGAYASSPPWDVALLIAEDFPTLSISCQRDSIGGLTFDFFRLSAKSLDEGTGTGLSDDMGRLGLLGKFVDGPDNKPYAYYIYIGAGNDVAYNNAFVKIDAGEKMALGLSGATRPTTAMLEVYGNAYFVVNLDAASNPPLTLLQDHLTGAQPCLTLGQDDISEGFIDFVGSARGAITGATNSTESARIELNGTVYRLALYADA